MSKVKILIFLLSFSTLAKALPTDSLYLIQQRQLSALEQKVQNIEQRNNATEALLKELKSQISTLSNEKASLNETLQQKQNSIDSLQKQVDLNSENIQATADTLGIRIQRTDVAVSQNAYNLKQNAYNLKTKTICGIVAFVIALLVSIIVALQLHKKGQKTSDDKISKLKKQADELNEKIVNQFSNEMSELKKISEALKNVGGNTTAEPDHSLVKTLADRITFMEMTLYRMDKTVRGYKQLFRSIVQMKDNLLANGYEIVDMLGKEYDEGMKVTANFVEDESIKAGKQIITGIGKPQINYKGVMIQSAQITVSQN